MSWTDVLTESTAALVPSGNPLEILRPRERAVLVVLGSDLDATAVAKLLHVSRETLYQDRRRAWCALTPVVPPGIVRAYEASVRLQSSATRTEGDRLHVRGRQLNGFVCPRCGGFAQREPGGLRCLHCGHTPLFRRVLPHDHWLSGTDWRARTRQRALDRAFMSSGGVPEIIFEMLERLEGRRRCRAGDGSNQVE